MMLSPMIAEIPWIHVAGAAVLFLGGYAILSAPGSGFDDGIHGNWQCPQARLELLTAMEFRDRATEGDREQFNHFLGRALDLEHAHRVRKGEPGLPGRTAKETP